MGRNRTGIVYLDIETIPGQGERLSDRLENKLEPPKTLKKQESIDRWWDENSGEALAEAHHKTGLSGLFGEIWCLAWAHDDGEARSISRVAPRPTDPEDTEARMLEMFFSQVHAVNPNPTWCGHNVLNFDLRFIWQRCVVLGLSAPFDLGLDSKPWDNTVLDTSSLWAGFRDYVKLDDLCFALDIEGKGDIDGSKVWDAVQAGRIDEVAEYCRDDVRRVQRLMNLLSTARR